MGRNSGPVYEAACELPAIEREAYVRISVSDPEAAGKLLEMLAGLDEADAPAATSRDSTGATAVPPIPRQLEPGDIVGRFTVIAFLGRGGMGEVYSADDPELGRQVALKLLQTGNVGTRGTVENFIREARAASALNHPGIVTIYQILRAEPSLAIVMELIEGAPLTEIAHQPNADGQVVAMGLQIAQALRAAHARGIVHRDIKPANVMRRDDGLLKVLDFGLARTVSEGSIDDVPLGTLGYMSPEQLKGGALSGATDIFSLGVILYELSTGTHPFLADSAKETTRAIALLDPGALRLADGAHVKNSRLDSLIRAMLAKDPAARPSAASVVTELQKLSESIDRRNSPAVRKLLVAVPLASILLVSSVWWLAARNRTPETRPVTVAQFTHLDGAESFPCFSPDGRKIAFAWNTPDRPSQDIFYQEIGSDTPVQLTRDDGYDSHPSWSPDGLWIAYVRRLVGSDQPVLALISADGKTGRVIAPVIPEGEFRGSVAWAPDGKSLIVRDDANGRIGFVRVDVATGAKRPLTVPKETETDHFAITSPDGRTIAFLRSSIALSSGEICLIPATAAHWTRGRTPRLLLPIASRRSPRSVAWPGARAARPSCTRKPIHCGGCQSMATPPEHLRSWRMANSSVSPVMRRDVCWWRNALIPTRTCGAPLWMVSIMGKSSRRVPPKATLTSHPTVRQPCSARSVPAPSSFGSAARMESSRASLISEEDSGSPRWSPDGKSIVFDGSKPSFEPSIRNTNIWIVPSTGGQPRRLTDDRSQSIVPAWSRDGRWIYYLKQTGSRTETWKIPSSEGGGGGHPGERHRNVRCGRIRGWQVSLLRLDPAGPHPRNLAPRRRRRR